MSTLAGATLQRNFGRSRKRHPKRMLQPLAMTERNAEFREICVRKVRQYVDTDVGRSKSRRILSKPEFLKPRGNGVRHGNRYARAAILSPRDVG